MPNIRAILYFIAPNAPLVDAHGFSVSFSTPPKVDDI
jgi:hypothetical protein